MEYKDYYDIMGVKRDVTADELKRSYRKLARKYHPDVSQEKDAETRFKEVGEAYEVLKDPEKRAAYDQLGSQWQAGQDFHPPPGWDAGFEFRGGGPQPGSPDKASPDFGAFSDFFESLYGRGYSQSAASGAHSRQGYQVRGEDHHAKVIVDLEDSYKGASRSITLQIPELTADGHVTTRSRTLKVRIPKGIRQGQQIRLAGQGGAGFGGGEAGDLYLEVEFSPRSHYRVEGADVYLDLPLAPWEAALGARVKVPTPSGAVDLKVPPNSQAGNKLRLKGRGIPARQTGDLYVVLEIALPPADSDEHRRIYENMKQEFTFNPRASLEVQP
jgi:curved DNA-binding protein